MERTTAAVNAVRQSPTLAACSIGPVVLGVHAVDGQILAGVPFAVL